MATLGNPQKTIEIIQKYEFAFQKKFGQNFLIDTHVLEKIIAAAGVTEDDCVLEIGPGIGTMTQYLAEHARSVVAVEIDKNLIPILQETLKEYENITIINDDILKVDINKLTEEYNYDANYYGALRRRSSHRQYYRHGSKRSGGTYAGRAGIQGLRSVVAGGAVLC